MLLLVSGCSDNPSGIEEGPDNEPAQSLQVGPAFSKGSAVIETDGRSIRLDLEIAKSPRQRAFGLMHRKSLPERAGMVFLFETENTGGFYMKDTLIPLSIAFLDEGGKVLRILDMEPCDEQPCRVYYPDVVYTSALEVNQGAFEKWGVSEGDVIELET